MLRTIEKEEISLQSITFDDIDPSINKKIEIGAADLTAPKGRSP
jgi:hypothetical protein